MNDQQYLNRNDTLEKIISFTLTTIENELEKLNDKIVTLEEAKNKVESVGGEVPKQTIIELENKKKKYAKLVNDRIEVELILNRIRKVRENTTLSEGQKFSEIKKITNPFFKTYENSYNSVDVKVNIVNGESQFKQIMKTTETYEKLSEKIDELEQKTAILTAKNLTNPPKPKRNPSPYDISKSDELQYKIRDLKTKQVQENSKQKVIMSVRQNKIDKRNAKISKIEAKAKYAKANANLDKSKKLMQRAEKLSKKNIFMMPSPVILFQQSVIATFRKTTFKPDGSYDYRPWAERRVEELERDSHKKL